VPCGDSGSTTLASALGPYEDYKVVWTILGTGAITIDAIQIVDASTGQVVASENAETSN
jgi:hypothetical protein